MTNATTFRRPTTTDGMRVHQLVANCPPLDPNSSYCNLLQCSHFAATSIAAETDGELMGFVSGYRLPEAPNTLFVWQVAVSEAARGQGLASRMLHALLTRSCNRDITRIETTITADNAGSWGLFTKLANALHCPLERIEHFDKDTHFQGQHASELLARVGPFDSAVLER